MKAYSSLIAALLVVTSYAGFIPGRRYCGYRLLAWGFPYEQLQAELRWWNKCDGPAGVNEALFRVYETWYGNMIVSLDDPCCMGCAWNPKGSWGDECVPRAVNVTTCAVVCE